jgi:hypothetical protein
MEVYLLTNKAVHKVDFAFTLPYQLRWTSLVDCAR